jgi:hypothetical protein
MAIEKTVFNYSTQGANADTVFAFLHDEASEYFDSVTQDSNKTIFCTIDEVNVLVLGFNGSVKSVTVTAPNGTSTYSNDTNRIWEYAYKTSKGIMLFSNRMNGSGNPYVTSVFITKDDSGNTAIAAIINTDTNDFSTRSLVTATTKTQANRITVFANVKWLSYRNAQTDLWYWATSVTAMVPLPLTGTTADYAPDLFFPVFSQFPYTPAVLTIGNTKYVSDGRLLLRE